MKYPEHVRLKDVQERSQAIGDFLVWLGDRDPKSDTGPIELAYYPFITETRIYDKDLNVIGYKPIPRKQWKRSAELESLTYNVQQLLAEFFEIDLTKIEDEKRQMLDECRAIHECPGSQ